MFSKYRTGVSQSRWQAPCGALFSAFIERILGHFGPYHPNPYAILSLAEASLLGVSPGCRPQAYPDQAYVRFQSDSSGLGHPTPNLARVR